MSLDEYLTREHDPGSGDGKPDRVRLTCRECRFTVRASPGVAIRVANAHAVATAHIILYRGTAQHLGRGWGT